MSFTAEQQEKIKNIRSQWHLENILKRKPNPGKAAQIIAKMRLKENSLLTNKIIVAASPLGAMAQMVRFSAPSRIQHVIESRINKFRILTDRCYNAFLVGNADATTYFRLENRIENTISGENTIASSIFNTIEDAYESLFFTLGKRKRAARRAINEAYRYTIDHNIRENSLIWKEDTPNITPTRESSPLFWKKTIPKNDSQITNQYRFWHGERLFNTLYRTVTFENAMTFEICNQVINYVLPLSREEKEFMEEMVELLKCNVSWYEYDEKIVIFENPTILNVDGTVLHSENGPAIAWRDGTALYFHKGSPIPAWIIDDSNLITIQMIQEYAVSGARGEIINAMISNYKKGEEPGGYARFILDLKPDRIARDSTGDLLYVGPFHKLNPLRQEMRMVEVTNGTPEKDGTFKKYYLPVPANTRTPMEGVAWSYGLNTLAYQRLIKRT